ncbi:MAG: Hpt domain-containing protein, partial [Desulfobacteraceae bacterium]|nr:Hpt domain-containing protein [Desulfobacteraceae bacterium]
VKDFCTEYGAFQNKMTKFLADSDFKGAATLSHSLKGAAGNISAVRLFESAKKLEQACWNKRPDEIERLLGPVQTDFEQVCRSAEQFFARRISEKKQRPQKAPEPDTPVSSENLMDRMRSLMNSLDQCDPVLSESLVQEMVPLVDRALHSKMDPLVHAVKQYQFDEAKKILQTLMKEPE